ncbi:MAG: DUF2249 domain-containing protein [Proteobacteria bacterium]|nr:DUF2249 domain-containing protein [Pseudomonadota bacterium]
MADEFILDAREMAPPEPFDKAIEILQHMQPGQYLRMLHRRVPYPLFDFCSALSLDYSFRETPAADFEIIIHFACDLETLRREGLL